jgi:hypothetical protein
MARDGLEGTIGLLTVAEDRLRRKVKDDRRFRLAASIATSGELGGSSGTSCEGDRGAADRLRFFLSFRCSADMVEVASTSGDLGDAVSLRAVLIRSSRVLRRWGGEPVLYRTCCSSFCASVGSSQSDGLAAI